MGNSEWLGRQKPEHDSKESAYKQRRIRMHDDLWADLLWLVRVTGAPSPAHIIREAVGQRVQEVRVASLARGARESKRSEPNERQHHNVGPPE